MVLLTSIAEHLQDLGPSGGFSYVPMERFIGLIKSLVPLMSNIDMNIANRMITIEHLNHLPRPGFLKEPQQRDLSEGADYPFASCPGNRSLLTPYMLQLLQIRFRAYTDQWPILPTGKHLQVWAKHHPRWRLSYGSALSQRGLVLNRRDDSYIYWQYKNITRYGRVELFCQAYNWEEVAFVRAYEGAIRDQYGRLKAIGALGGLETILVTEISGLIGRITKPMGNLPVTFLVTAAA
jgi:hypothetical protein